MMTIELKESAAAATTAGGALQLGRGRLAGLEDGALIVPVLVAHVLGISRTQVLAHPETPLSAEQAAALEGLLARAAGGEPLAYLTGRREFYGLDFEVDANVLVPRPETERMVDLGRAARPERILDVGTGSGCIAVTLAVHLPQAALTAIDISPAALAVARRNAARHHVAGRITFVESDLLAALPQSGSQPPFNLITANLPYVDSAEVAQVPAGWNEPRLALDGGPDGLRVIERLLRQAPAHLAAGGLMLLEIGATQGSAAANLARAAFREADVTVEPDLTGLNRVVAVRLPG